MRKKRLRRKHIPSFYFSKVAKRHSDIEELISAPIILEMKDGNFYAGTIDDVEARIVSIYHCKKFVNKEIDLDYTEKTWEDYKIFTVFPLKDIKNIYKSKDESLALDQMLEITVNPMQGIVKGIECSWVEDKIHSESCDEDLHESLAYLYKMSENNSKSEKESQKVIDAFNKVRRFIIENKGKIP